MRESIIGGLSALLIVALSISAAAANVQLLEPENGRSFLGVGLVFAFRATLDNATGPTNTTQLDNATFWIGNASGWAPRDSQRIFNFTNDSVQAAGIAGLTSGYNVWNVEVWEKNASQASWAGANRSFSFTLASSPTPSPSPSPGPDNSGSCRSLFEFDLPDVLTIARETVVDVPVVLRNTAAAAQVLTLSVHCGSLSCSFSDVPLPNLLAVGETRVVHLTLESRSLNVSQHALDVSVLGGPSSSACQASRVAVVNVTENPDLLGFKALRASVTPSQSVVYPGETIEYALVLSNAAADRLFASVSTPGLPFPSSLSSGATDVVLLPGEARSVPFSLTIPSGVPGGDYDFAFSLSFRTSSGPADSAVVPVRVRVVGDSYKLRVQPEPPLTCWNASASSPYTWETYVRNDGSGVATAYASVEGSDILPSILSVSPDLFEVRAGESQRVRITVQPSRKTALGTHHGFVRLSGGDFTLWQRAVCVKVVGVTTFGVDTPESVSLLRGRSLSIPVSVRNRGNVLAEYSLEVSAGSGLLASVDPVNVSLAAGQTAQATVVLQSSLRVPLGVTQVDLTVRPRSGEPVTARVAVDVQSSNASGESPLVLQGVTSFDVVDGVTREFDLEVANQGDVALKGVRLELLDIPSGWYLAPTKDIPAKGKAVFPLLVSVQDPSRDLYPLTVALSSGLERVHYPGALSVSPQVRKLEIRNVSALPKRANGSTSEVLVDMVLKNSGNVPASDVQPILFDSGGELEPSLYAVPEGAVELAPGEERTVQFRIRPAASVSAEQLATLQVASKEGARAAVPVKVPSLSQASVASFPWPLAIVVVLALVGAFAYFANREAGEGHVDAASDAGPDMMSRLSSFFSSLGGGSSPAPEARAAAGPDVSGMKARLRELEEQQRMLQYRYLKREIDEMTFQSLSRDNEREVTQLKVKLLRKAAQ